MGYCEFGCDAKSRIEELERENSVLRSALKPVLEAKTWHLFNAERFVNASQAIIDSQRIYKEGEVK